LNNDVDFELENSAQDLELWQGLGNLLRFHYADLLIGKVD